MDEVYYRVRIDYATIKREAINNMGSTYVPPRWKKQRIYKFVHDILHPVYVEITNQNDFAFAVDADELLLLKLMYGDIISEVNKITLGTSLPRKDGLYNG